MYCFWSGEGYLGGIDGVLSTKAGFMNGEVVKVTYDSSIISSEELKKLAIRQSMQFVPNTNFNHSSRDEDYYLQHSAFKFLPLTEVQRTKINSALINKKDAVKYLSPKQKNWLQNSRSNKVLFDQDFQKSWASLNQ